MYLRSGEICPISSECPYINSAGSYCQGTNPDRPCPFTCSFVTPDGKFVKPEHESNRNQYDLTGKMTILTEGS